MRWYSPHGRQKKTMISTIFSAAHGRLPTTTTSIKQKGSFWRLYIGGIEPQPIKFTVGAVNACIPFARRTRTRALAQLALADSEVGLTITPETRALNGPLASACIIPAFHSAALSIDLSAVLVLHLECDWIYVYICSFGPGLAFDGMGKFAQFVNNGLLLAGIEHSWSKRLASACFDRHSDSNQDCENGRERLL